MLNKEKYAKEIVEIVTMKSPENIAFDTRIGKLCKCTILECDNCLFRTGKGICDEKRNIWANSEYVELIKLTLAEKIILENIDSNFKWIARGENNYLFCHERKPMKSKVDRMMFLDGGHFSRIPFDNLFKFIKWEDNEPYKIKDILNNCEVVEDVD
ncbi:hypothetical protein [Candidatus Stoquefichus sp. SB1]|uniref:hypothetical protein n=1 Tax=Candidatus Stoquefichus sp. SB1 TaxID=1658109 RepID=UPI00067F65F3|nr:hypothetical protein [Candidatus Stoquefichus sp. SB1]